MTTETMTAQAVPCGRGTAADTPRRRLVIRGLNCPANPAVDPARRGAVLSAREEVSQAQNWNIEPATESVVEHAGIRWHFTTRPATEGGAPRC